MPEHKKEVAYLAGPLFTKYELAARQAEHKLFKRTFPRIDVYAPADAPINKGTPTDRDIWNMDNENIDKSNIFIIDLNNSDPGTMVEVGLAVEKHKTNPEIEIYGFLWDIRLSRGAQTGKTDWERPWGYNGFVIGAIQTHGKLFYTFEEVLEYMKEKRRR